MGSQTQDKDKVVRTAVQRQAQASERWFGDSEMYGRQMQIPSSETRGWKGSARKKLEKQAAKMGAGMNLGWSEKWNDSDIDDAAA